MLNLISIKEIANAFKWILGIGKDDIKHVRDETEELLHHLSKSVKSLRQVVSEVTSLSESEFDDKRFSKIYDHFKLFYLYPEHQDKARTHCSDLQRDIGRIEHKLAHVLRTDLGKWKLAKNALGCIIDGDLAILESYSDCIKDLDSRLKRIQADLESGHESRARESYLQMKKDLSADIEELRSAIQIMREADAHIRTISG